MRLPQLNRRFLASTRGKVVELLRNEDKTVGELAAALALTENAVRQHLATLERDGLVEQAGLRPGVRKPFHAYRLTAEAEHLFPKAYGLALSQLLWSLSEKLTDEQFEDVMRGAGARLAEQFTPADAPPERRLQLALQSYSELGGQAEMEVDGERRTIRGDSCPLGAVAADHPEMCLMLEEMLSRILGLQVRSICDGSGTPQCCFELPRTA